MSGTARPRIAVTRSRTANVPDYAARLIEAGLEPVELFEPGVTLSGYDGLLISGGRDIDPALYGEDPHPETQTPNQERDDLDLSLLREALDRDLPVLAICRGHQLLNVCFGGSLLQHIDNDSHEAQEEPPNASSWHPVALVPETKTAAALGAGTLLVNSRHHQAVTPDRLAPGLRSAGTTSDGYVEAVESEQHRWVVGVQWHPERLEPETPGFAAASARQFRAFAAAAGVSSSGSPAKSPGPSPSQMFSWS